MVRDLHSAEQPRNERDEEAKLDARPGALPQAAGRPAGVRAHIAHGAAGPLRDRQPGRDAERAQGFSPCVLQAEEGARRQRGEPRGGALRRRHEEKRGESGGENTLFCVFQENFHAVVLKGVRSSSDTLKFP